MRGSRIDWRQPNEPRISQSLFVKPPSGTLRLSSIVQSFRLPAVTCLLDQPTSAQCRA